MPAHSHGRRISLWLVVGILRGAASCAFGEYEDFLLIPGPVSPVGMAHRTHAQLESGRMGSHAMGP